MHASRAVFGAPWGRKKGRLKVLFSKLPANRVAEFMDFVECVA
jgi:hypothetical protein